MSTPRTMPVFQPTSRVQRVFEKCCDGISDSKLDEFCKEIGVNKSWALKCIKEEEKRGWSDPPLFRKRTNHIGYKWRYEYLDGLHRVSNAAELG